MGSRGTAALFSILTTDTKTRHSRRVFFTLDFSVVDSLEACQRDVSFFCWVQVPTKESETVSEGVLLPVKMSGEYRLMEPFESTLIKSFTSRLVYVFYLVTDTKSDSFGSF